jgi:hypothetical protein
VVATKGRYDKPGIRTWHRVPTIAATGSHELWKSPRVV